MFERSDEKLIAKAIKGNKAAWMELLKRYESQIYNYALRMVGDRDDALDLLQDIFIAVFRNLSSFRGESKFKTWLFRIAHYRCIEYYRRKKPWQALDDEPEQVAEEKDSCPQSELMQSQQAENLVRSLQILPVNQRLVVEMKFFQQFTFDEIATQLGVSSNTVKSRLYSALDKLKVELELDYV